MVKLNEVSPIDDNNTSVRDPQSSSINIDQTATTQSRTFWEQIRTKKWIRIVLPILRSGDTEKTLSTETTTTMITATTETTTTTITTTIITTTTAVMNAATETTTTSGSCLTYTVLARFDRSIISDKSILLVNINEDTKLDIIVGYDGEETIMIFLNLDDGTFTQSKINSHEIRLSRITTGDINNDGKLDIIAPSSISMEIIVFYNAGNGNFNNSMIIPTEDMIFDVKAVDINKDNKLDFIAVDSSTGHIIIILNDGNGVFSKQIRYENISFLHKLEVIDMNNDALPDIVAIYNGLGSSMLVLLNINNGNFIEQERPSFSLTPKFIRAIDINGDNEVDLIMGYYYDFHIHFGFRNGTFADRIDYHSDYQLTSLETANFDNDNKMYIILSHFNNNKISIFSNTGNGTFGEPKIIDNIDQPTYATMIDIKSDDKAELVVASDQTITILYLRC
ncbi:unnamed protein product [Adineta steineri]|uniref:Uncharacterized protein n=1 Tax=Adineta steineri TaxID=433720 RepID=A0A815V244_9BILA|nr:unnamed protein product [Adineta steineri]CAF1526509.1 unnamed protein product [Adineta steineri]